MEDESCKMIVVSPKCYQLKTKEGQTKSYWAGKSKEYTSKLAFGDMKTVDHLDLFGVEWNADTLKWEIRT